MQAKNRWVLHGTRMQPVNKIIIKPVQFASLPTTVPCLTPIGCGLCTCEEDMFD